MGKTRAYGADCVLLAAFEASYGVLVGLQQPARRHLLIDLMIPLAVSLAGEAAAVDQLAHLHELLAAQQPAFVGLHHGDLDSRPFWPTRASSWYHNSIRSASGWAASISPISAGNFF